MAVSTEAERRFAHEQALANTRIEGHVPTPEFLADCEAVIAGTMTEDEALAKHPELKGAFDSLRVMQHLLDERFPGNELAQGRYAAQARSEALRRLDSGQLIASPRELPKAQEKQAGDQVGGRSGGIDR